MNRASLLDAPADLIGDGDCGVLLQGTPVRYLGAPHECASRWLEQNGVYLVESCTWDDTTEDMRLRLCGVHGLAFLRSLFGVE